MDVERVVEPDGRIQLWGFDWDLSEPKARKVNRRRIGYEKALAPVDHRASTKQEVICWSYDRTVGNIAVSDESLLGQFSDSSGDDAILACEFVQAGKMRNGKPRSWCRTHQRHWGTKADIAAALEIDAMRCSNHDQPMSYVVDPERLSVEGHAEVGIWCSMPPALTNAGVPQARPPRIHVHVRETPGAEKSIDRDYRAISLHYNADDNLFGNVEITRVHLTPPSALDFVLALEEEKEMGCINCKDCGYPHLDLGEFARNAHRKHLCGNCGRDSTWSRAPMTSTPLKPLHDQFSRANKYLDVQKEIDLDDYSGLKFQVWASTPAVLWTASRPQERGIHVHVYEDNRYLVDDTFGVVWYRGKTLDRGELFRQMVANTIA